MGIKPTPKMSCISNIHQTMGNVQHNTGIMNEPVTNHSRSKEGGLAPLKTMPAASTAHRNGNRWLHYSGAKWHHIPVLLFVSDTQQIGPHHE